MSWLPAGATVACEWDEASLLLVLSVAVGSQEHRLGLSPYTSWGGEWLSLCWKAWDVTAPAEPRDEPFLPEAPKGER